MLYVNLALIDSIALTIRVGSRFLSFEANNETATTTGPKAITKMTINNRGLIELIRLFGSLNFAASFGLYF
jgi:hypothetical protein